MDYEDRIVTSEVLGEDFDAEPGLRPKSLADYVGQNKIKENLQVYIEAAVNRKEALDHVLLYVPSRPAPSREVDGLFDVNVALDWLLDPAALSSSDIKARLSLARDGGGREGEPTPVEETLWEDGF